MEFYLYLCTFAAIILFLMVQYVLSQREKRRRLKRKIHDSWGKIPEKEYTYEEFNLIPHYFKRKQKDEFVIDDITWNDLDMDSIFLLMNHTWSSIGQEYLYRVLRTPSFDRDELRERSRLAEYFRRNGEVREKLQFMFAGIGKNSRYALADYVYTLGELKGRKNTPHYLALGILAAAIVSFFLEPMFGIMIFIVAMIVNITQYYRLKAEVENYFVCVKTVVKLVSYAKSMAGIQAPELSDYQKKLKKASAPFSSFERQSGMLSGGESMGGSIVDVIFDYVRMMTHIDLIGFNRMLKVVQTHPQEIELLLDTLGQLETGLAIGSFRDTLAYWCEPDLTRGESVHFRAENLYHPLIDHAVPNSIDEVHSVLLTGSNASGKSTFLKMVAINGILAQTIHTVTAESYRSCFCKIYSSMALRDDLGSSESYYIVEIKSLKRVMDAAGGEIPVFCFIDEVLRGTNTVERISASSKILQMIAGKNVMCFAATHDIELTKLLDGIYSNYHFQEEMGEDDVIFNYQLMDGPATTRNAIRLLKMMGYDDRLIEEAENTAARFLKTGEWKL